MSKSESQSYRDILGQVETIIQQISDPQVDLDDLVSKVEKGYELIELLQKRLDTTLQRIETLQNRGLKSRSDTHDGNSDE